MIRELVAQLCGGGDTSGRGVGEHRCLGVGDGDGGERLTHAGGGLFHKWRMTGDADLQSHGALCARGTCRDYSGFDGGDFTGEHDLPRRVAIGEDQDAELCTSGDHVSFGALGQAKDGGHGSRPSAARCLHQLTTSSREPHAIGNGERASGNCGGVLASRVPSDQDRFVERCACGGGAFTRGGEHGDGDGEDGRLCNLGALQGFGWAGRHQLAERLAECGLSLRQHGACGRGACECGGTHADALRALPREDPRGDRRHAANPSRPPRGLR